MSTQSKALKAHRKRLRTKGLRRVELSVRAEQVALLRDVAARLREKPAEAKRIKSAIWPESGAARRKTLSETLYDPAIAGPEFDDVFDEIERARRDPVVQRTRDIDL
jgi:hypothetical protein